MNNNKSPLISVVVTTYNRKELLKETLDSIINQTFTDFELIVVDNYSDYDFMEYMKSFNDKRIRAFQNQNNGIIAVNRNVGIKKAKGKYIAFCDDDDLWVEEKLEKQIPYLQKDANIIGVGSTTKLFGELKLRRQKQLDSDIEIDFEKAFLFITCPLSSLIINNNNVYFDESPNLRAVEDFEFQLRLLRQTGKRFLLLYKPLVLYRVHPDNISTANEINAINVLDKYKNSVSMTLYQKARVKAYLTAGIKAVRQRNIKLSREFSVKVIKDSKFNLTMLKAIALYMVSLLPKKVTIRIFKAYYSAY